MNTQLKLPRMVTMIDGEEKRIVLKLNSENDTYAPILYSDIKAGDVFLWEGKQDGVFQLCYARDDVSNGWNNCDIISLNTTNTDKATRVELDIKTDIKEER